MTSPEPLDPGLLHLLAVWMPRQRWYPAKGRGVGIRRLGTTSLLPPDDGARGVEVEVLVVGLDSGDRVDVAQVPLTYRDRPLDDDTASRGDWERRLELVLGRLAERERLVRLGDLRQALEEIDRQAEPDAYRALELEYRRLLTQRAGTTKSRPDPTFRA